MMDIITRDEFSKAADLPPPVLSWDFSKRQPLAPDMHQKVLNLFNVPNAAHTELAAQIKVFIDNQIANELRDIGGLSENTRRWVETYASIINLLHKNKWGDKVTSYIVSEKIDMSKLSTAIRESSKESKPSKGVIVDGTIMETNKAQSDEKESS